MRRRTWQGQPILAPACRLLVPMTADALLAEARRQLGICNACRYCEGYCAVFPALERRSILLDGDVAYLANTAQQLCEAARSTLTPYQWEHYLPTGPAYRNVCPRWG